MSSYNPPLSPGNAASSISAAEALITRVHGIGNAVPSKFLEYSLTSRAPHVLSEAVILQKHEQCPCKAIHIVLVHHEPGLPILDGFGNRTRAARDNRNTGRHRLNWWNAKSFIP